MTASPFPAEFNDKLCARSTAQVFVSLIKDLRRVCESGSDICIALKNFENVIGFSWKENKEYLKNKIHVEDFKSFITRAASEEIGRAIYFVVKDSHVIFVEEIKHIVFQAVSDNLIQDNGSWVGKDAFGLKQKMKKMEDAKSGGDVVMLFDLLMDLVGSMPNNALRINNRRFMPEIASYFNSFFKMDTSCLSEKKRSDIFEKWIEIEGDFDKICHLNLSLDYINNGAGSAVFQRIKSKFIRSLDSEGLTKCLSYGCDEWAMSEDSRGNKRKESVINLAKKHFFGLEIENIQKLVEKNHLRKMINVGEKKSSTLSL